jgi:hypothetical protein
MLPLHVNENNVIPAQAGIHAELKLWYLPQQDSG